MPEVCLRKMDRRDLETVLRWRNHPDVRLCMRMRVEITMDEHLAWFERVSTRPDHVLFIAEEDDVGLGFIQFSGITPGSSCEWGFYAAPGAPRGSGGKLCRAALDYAFEIAGVHKVCGQILDFNEASVRLHQRLGFRQEGTQREQVLVDGRYHDLVLFGLLDREWPRSSKVAELR